MISLSAAPAITIHGRLGRPRPSGNAHQRRVRKRWLQRNAVRPLVNGGVGNMYVHDCRGHMVTVEPGMAVDVTWRSGNELQVLGEPFAQELIS